MKKIIINTYLMIIFSLILIGCSSTITITYIVNNEINSQEVLKNTTLENITFYGINEEYIEELYKDKNYTIKYNNEKIKEDTIIYIKLKQVVINFHIDNTIIAKNISMGSKITNDILPVNIDYIEGIYLDNTFNSLYLDYIIDNNIDLYIKMKKVNVTYTYKDITIIKNINMGSYLHINETGILDEEYLDGLYYDEALTIKYEGQRVIQDTTIYLKPNYLGYAIYNIKQKYVIRYNEFYEGTDQSIKYEDVEIEKVLYQDDNICAVLIKGDIINELSQNVWYKEYYGYYLPISGNVLEIRIWSGKNMFTFHGAYISELLSEEQVKEIYNEYYKYTGVVKYEKDN